MSIGLATVIKGIQVWTAIKPFKRWKARRQRKREARRREAEAAGGEYLYDDQEDSMEPKYRTSTKAGGAGLVALLLLKAAEFIPWEPLSALVATPEFAQVITLGVMYLVARFSKTPTTPGKL